MSTTTSTQPDSRTWLASLIGRLVHRPPDFVIGGPDDPYLLRWHLVPKNRWLNVYLHKFCRSDDDRALHDHPWAFASVLLAGRYNELRARTTTFSGLGPATWVRRRAPSIVFRRATDAHRLQLVRGDDGRELPAWTVVVTGPKRRAWGFWCPRGWIPWQRFASPADRGAVGRGCD